MTFDDEKYWVRLVSEGNFGKPESFRISIRNYDNSN